MRYYGPKTPRPFSLKPNREPSMLQEHHRYTLPIFAFDPGGTTGWSLMKLSIMAFERDDQQWAFEHQQKWLHGQIDCRNDHDLRLGIWQIKSMIDLYPNAAIVFESFNIRYIGVDLSPIKIISAVQQHLWETGRKMFLQSANQAKTTATDDRLKLWNMYQRTGGLNHARDADRHVILFLRRCLGASGEQLRREAWPYVKIISN